MSTQNKRAKSVDDDRHMKSLKRLKSVVRQCESLVNPLRVRRLNGSLVPGQKIVKINDDAQSVIYWMERDNRTRDNWALLYAQELAIKHNINLAVIYVYPKRYREATARQELFLLHGLEEVESRLRQLSIPFHFFKGSVVETVIKFAKRHEAGCVVTDFTPIREKRQWRENVANALTIPLMEVDAHNVVPCWVASDKLEVGARTLRPKLYRKLAEFGTEFPEMKIHSLNERNRDTGHQTDEDDGTNTNWADVRATVDVLRNVDEVKWCMPGEAAAMTALESFVLGDRLKIFSDKRNDPTVMAQSNLSPYFNFGHLSAQRAFLAVQGYSGSKRAGVDAFIEEMIVRRELADNFCFYKLDTYDSLEGAADWALASLQLHSEDKREYVYTAEEFASASTHDDLWNAAQLQLVQNGKMHGFLRMYWAKKILEWSESPQQALSMCITLNDRYSLDGYNPNGYVGCAWSICGVHDMGWKERPIFGKIRYMNYAGCLRKFNVYQFVQNYPMAIKNCKARGGIPTKEKKNGNKNTK
eukprot:CFRG0230T1